MEHAFADGAKLNAEVRIKVSAGQRDLCLPALPKDLGNRNRVSDDLNRTAEKTSGNFGYSRSATEDDCLPILNEIRGSASDPRLFVLATDREPLEVERFFARRSGHSAAVNAAEVSIAFQFNQIATNRCPGSIEPGTQILEADEVLPREGFLDESETLNLVHTETRTIVLSPANSTSPGTRTAIICRQAPPSPHR